MVPTPKDHFKQYPFVDRKGHIQTFKEAVHNIGQKEFSVLVYYGVAGIGKTSLRKELSKYLEKYNLKNQQQDITWVSIQQQEFIWASIDLQLDKHREKTAFLVTLKNELQSKSKIKFPAFEIAHAIYWKKANPEIPLRKENYLLFEGDDALDDFFGAVEQVPYLQVVPTTARLLKKAPTPSENGGKREEKQNLNNFPKKNLWKLKKLCPISGRRISIII
ncbi:hypothetical protein RG963_11790 [Methanosarcina sp. Z-7115]|uniref:Orc1-like AAA ATPase domain-containing protein n=1 Tax=Methanosarcina baikalica TaxID=3073890 RepID=A0ABU2D389_9EURY|nr:hypothetical protein [Methanosarcina sp. Z-7115]MDR7666450.1 hypothetical protein [Methanosarcina sp. Z-7115]